MGAAAKVLIIGPGMLPRVGRVLTGSGYCVLRAPDPRRALAIVRRSPPVDVVLANSGFHEPDTTLIGKIKRLSPSTATVFISGRGPAAPMPPEAEVLWKPFSDGALLRRVARVLAEAAQARTALRQEIERAGRLQARARELAGELMATDWALSKIVATIRSGDASGAGQLFQPMSRGIRLLLARALPPDCVEDAFEDVQAATVRAIQGDCLNDPSCLARYVRGLVQDKIRAYESRPRDADAGPREDAAAGERTAIMREVLLGLGSRDREALSRVYVLGESEQQIAARTGLSAAELRMLKSKLKARFADLVRSAPDRH